MSRKTKSSRISSSNFSSSSDFGGFGSFGDFVPSSPLSSTTKPLDLSSLPPELVVIVKNIQKRDPITRAKGLQDLQARIGDGIDDTTQDALLNLWVVLYPPAVTDFDRQVRVRAHTTHTVVCNLVKRKLSKHLKGLIGPWMTSLYDSDRTVARAAAESFNAVFDTEEKRQIVVEKYSGDVLKYIMEVLSGETAKTISDERFMSVEDMDTRFALVVGMCLSCIVALIGAPQKEKTMATDVLEPSILKKISGIKDIPVQRPFYRLLGVIVKYFPDAAQQHSEDYAQYIRKALSSITGTTVNDFLELLISASNILSSLWIPGKKSLREPFVKLLSQGSINSNTEYWRRIELLFKILRSEERVETIELIKWVNDGLLAGAAKEMRPSAETAYEISYNILINLIASIEDESARNATLNSEFRNKLHQYLASTESALPQERYLAHGLSAALLNLSRKRPEDFEAIWSSECSWLQSLITHVLSSERSEGSFKIASHRWVEITMQMLFHLTDTNSQDIVSSLLKPASELFKVTLQTASNFRGSWVDGISFLSTLLENPSFMEFFRTNKELEPAQHALMDFMSPTNITQLLHSPSSGSFINMLFSFYTLFGEKAQSVWEVFAGEVLAESQALDIHDPNSLLARVAQMPKSRWEGLRGLARPPQSNSQNLARQVSSALEEGGPTDVAEGKRIEELIVSIMLLRDILVTNETSTAIFWNLNHSSGSFLRILESICRRDPQFLSFIFLEASTDTGSESATISQKLAFLLYNVFRNQVDHESNSLITALEAAISTVPNVSITVTACVQLVRKLVEESDSTSASSQNTILDFVQWLLKFLSGSEKIIMLQQLLKFQPVGDLPFPDPSLALTSALGTFFLPFTLNSNASADYSPNLSCRLAMFFASFLKHSENSVKALIESDDGIIDHLLIFLLLHSNFAKDSLAYRTSFTTSAFPGVSDSDLLEFQNDCITIIEKLPSSTRDTLISRLKAAANGKDANAYYHARALCDILPVAAELGNLDGVAASAELRAAKEVDKGGFQLPAVVVGYGELLSLSKDLTFLLNGLVSSVSGIIAGTTPLSTIQGDGLQALSALNTMSEGNEGFWSSMKAFRILMLIRTILRWTEAVVDSPSAWIVSTELFRLMKSLLPAIKELNGDFWETVIELLKSSLESCIEEPNERLPLQYSSLKFLNDLSSLETTADRTLYTIWPSERNALFQTATCLLIATGNTPQAGQPAEMRNALLRRVVQRAPPSVIGDDEASQLFPLLSIAPKDIREASYVLLANYIPRIKEDIEIEAALGPEGDITNIPNLPDELLSIIVDTDVLHFPEGSEAEPSRRRILEGYLMAWSLLFKYFHSSSFKVRSKYLQTLAEGTYVSSLFLAVVRELYLDTERPVPLSEVPETFDLGEADDDEVKLQRNTGHVFAEALRYASSLLRSEWFHLREHALQERIQSYVAKYFSRALIDDELDTISKAISNSEISEENLEIRVNKSTKEIITRYQVDEGEKNEMLIRLPPSYPLAEVEIDGKSRVGVTQERWNKWLLTCKIACKNGTIIDALTLFASNAKGYFAHLNECAICYGVVAVDRTLPSKKCPNGHWFHAICLYKWFKSSHGSTCPLCRVTFTVS